MTEGGNGIIKQRMARRSNDLFTAGCSWSPRLPACSSGTCAAFSAESANGFLRRGFRHSFFRLGQRSGVLPAKFPFHLVGPAPLFFDGLLQSLVFWARLAKRLF